MGDRLKNVPAIAFIKTPHRSDANFGFRDSYFFPKTPWFASGENVYSLTPPRPDGSADLSAVEALANELGAEFRVRRRVGGEKRSQCETGVLDE